MSDTSFKTYIVNLFAKKLWPWFKESIWPLLREHVLEIVSWALGKLKSGFKEWVETRSKTQQSEATHKAEEAEERARSANTETEKETYRAIAAVWQEVAEKFRVENELLKVKLEEFTSQAESEILEKVRASDPTIDTSADRPILLLENKKISVPPLPIGAE